MTYISDAGRTGSDKPRRSLTITPSMKTTTCLRSSPCSSSTKACACALTRNAAPSTSRSVAPLTSAGGQWTWRCKLAVNTTVAIGVMVCPAGDRNQWVKSISLSLALQRLWRTPSVVPAVALLRKNCLNVAVCHVPFRSSYDRASSWLRFVYNRSSYPGVSRSLGFPRHARFSANRLLRVRPVATRHRGSAPYRSALPALRRGAVSQYRRRPRSGAGAQHRCHRAVRDRQPLSHRRHRGARRVCRNDLDRRSADVVCPAGAAGGDAGACHCRRRADVRADRALLPLAASALRPSAAPSAVCIPHPAARARVEPGGRVSSRHAGDIDKAQTHRHRRARGGAVGIGRRDAAAGRRRVHHRRARTVGTGRLVTMSATAAELSLFSCQTCSLVARPAPAAAPLYCPRCGARLHLRKPDSARRTWALLIAAYLLYIPANVLPIMQTDSLFKGRDDTIMSGIVYLWTSGSWPIALLVFFASIVTPLLKLLILSMLQWSVQRRWHWQPRQRVRLYRLVLFFGRWSMLDIYVVTALVALMQTPTLAMVSAAA